MTMTPRPDTYVAPIGNLKVHKYASPITDDILTVCGIAPGAGPIVCSATIESVTCTKCLEIINGS